ncbi:3819_t:CDS:2, partial [Acaulospora morrowiae]
MSAEYREMKNYNDAGHMRGKYYNISDETPEFTTDYSKFGVKGYALFWHMLLLSFINMAFGIFPTTVFIGLTLSIIYACTASLDFIRGQPMTCPRKYDPKFYAIPGIDNSLNLTCQYHIKVAIASW